MLIVGCGCRGQALARELVPAGHAVRGTTRSADRKAAIEAAGAEAVVADPDRLASLLPWIEGVSAVCCLLASATGEPQQVAALHGPRLCSLLERLVDSPVRGFVYEATGAVDPIVVEGAVAAVRGAGESFRMPVELVTADPDDHGPWLAAASAAVGRVLG